MKKKNEARKQVSSSGTSIYDVADRAGVSIVTVSRVFNDYPHVSRRMRDRVFEAARDVGYTPRLVAKRNVLAVIIGHLDHLSAGDYKTRLLLYIVQTAARRGYLIEFIPADSVELATQHLVDGVIEVGLTDEEVLRLSHLPQVPTILTNKRARRKEWSTVSSDHAFEGRLATEHLLDHGHRRIALILDDPTGLGVEQRRQGYEKAGQSRDRKKFAPLVFCTSSTSPLEIAHQIKNNRCTACVNLSDNFGLAVLDSCVHELGMKIPDELSVVSLENKSVSQFWNPRLTTVEQPLQELAEGAVGGVLELIENPSRRFDRAFKGRLIERDSVRKTH